MHTRYAHTWLALLLVFVSTLVASVIAQPATGSGNGFLLLQMPPMGVYQVAMAEQSSTTTLTTTFPNASVQCVDLRVSTTGSATKGSPFELLFLIGGNPFSNTAPLPPLTVNVTALQTNLTTAFATAVPSVSGNISLQILTATAVLTSRGRLPSLQSLDPPSASANIAFLRVDMSFRNMLAPSNLTQSLVFQTRRGIQQFLGLASVEQVIPIGPPTVPPSSVLLLTQSYFILLNNNATDATMDNRQRLANLLIYGDPARLLPDPTTSELRSSMFLDYAAPNEPPMDPTVMLTLPYVFSSLSVDVFPSGNPPAPEPAIAPGTIVIPATPTDQLLARVRKRHVFSFANDSSVAASEACPSIAGGGLCVKLQWNNTLDGMPFWVESIESVDALAWNVAPSIPFCATTDTPLPLLASPTIPLGIGASVWAIAPVSPTATRMAFALHLRSLDDNTTRVAVEISADLRSAVQAATTVTSIARRMSNDTPVYASRSNVFVAYDTQFQGTELSLALTLQLGDITTKDTSAPCAHCQNLYEWCRAQPACQALMNCVFRDGLEASQIPATLLQRISLIDAVVDVSLTVRQCLANPDLDALLLFASAVRCQLQRQCTVRTASDYALTGLDDRLLLWEATDGVLQFSVSPVITNVTLRLLDTPLCSFAPASFTRSDLEDFLSRQCAYATHWGRVVVNMTTNSTLELRFQDLVGPLPTVDVPMVVTALPGLALRLELSDFATALPPLPPVPTPSAAATCQSKCRSLALDGCLRDTTCIAFTDCVTRTPINTTSVLGDALLQLFENRVVGDSLSLQLAIDRCAPADDADVATRRAWRLLADASACYAKFDCSLSLQGVVLPPAPDGDAVVGKWRFEPTPIVTQRLFYEQQPDDASVVDTVPLAYDVYGKMASSRLDPAALATAFQSLLQFDDVNVTLVASVTDTTSGRQMTQWDITYAFWLGRLPRVVDASLAPRWRLVDMPNASPIDVQVEMVANVDTTLRDNATTVEIGV